MVNCGWSIINHERLIDLILTLDITNCGLIIYFIKGKLNRIVAYESVPLTSLWVNCMTR
jgi:hypothetical protein